MQLLRRFNAYASDAQIVNVIGQPFVFKLLKLLNLCNLLFDIPLVFNLNLCFLFNIFRSIATNIQRFKRFEGDTRAF